MAAHQLREARVGEHVAVVAERGKEYGAKTYSFLKGMYGSVAGQVENIARDNGYKVDLGAAPLGGSQGSQTAHLQGFSLPGPALSLTRWACLVLRAVNEQAFAYGNGLNRYAPCCGGARRRAARAQQLCAGGQQHCGPL